MGFATSHVQFPSPGAPHLAETWSCTESAQIGSSTRSAGCLGWLLPDPCPPPREQGTALSESHAPTLGLGALPVLPGRESPRPAPRFPLLRDFALGSWQRLPPSSATRSTREPGCWPGGSGPDRGWGHGMTAEDRELCLGSQLPATLAARGEGKGARFHLAVTPQSLTAEDK